MSFPPESISAKKPYRSPELTAWGSIVDLTQGAAGGFDDFPLKGGTKGV